MGNGLVAMIVVVALLILVPVIIFFGLLWLTMFIWCWRRVGPYFVNFGRWMADWRNCLPCGCMVLVSLVLLLVVVPLFLPSVIRTLGLVLLILVVVVCGTFAVIVLTVRTLQWFWVGYRRQFWGWMNSLWDLLWRRAPERIERRMPGGRGDGRQVKTKPPSGKPASVRQSGLARFWALMLGKAPEPTKASKPIEAAPRADVQPSKKAPPKRSWFGSFWALMLGKPAKPIKPKAAPVKIQTTEQSLGQSESIASTAKTEATIPTAVSGAPRADKRALAKRSWFGAFWSLMLGRPAKSTKPKTGPAKVKTSEQASRPSETAAATAKTGATARVAEAATTPERTKKEKPAKRGFFAGMWTSIVRGVTFVAGLVFLGVVWVVQKIREGIEWIRIRLNLD